MVFNDQTKGNCLWVINPQDHLNPYFPDLLSSAVPLSNLSRIHSRSVSDDFPPVDLFGDEPDHGWCYYYEKADLSRQTEDWDTVLSLGQQVLAEGFSPDKSASNSPHEWVPFIEGFAYEGYWDTAEELTFAGIERDKKYTEMYCNLWKSIDQNVVNDEQEQAVFNNIYGSLNCERFTIDQ